MNLACALSQTSARLPDHPAITWGERTLTWAEFDCRTDGLAHALRAAGAISGDRIAVVMRNRPELLETMYAAFKAAMVVVPLNAKLSSAEVTDLLEDSEAAVLVTDTEAIAPPGVVVLHVGSEYEDTIHNYVGDGPVMADVDTAAAAWLFYTSGTTGKPKGAVLTHGGLAFVVASWLADLTPIDHTDVTMHAAPLSHGAGFHALAAVARGAHQIIPAAERFDPQAVLALMRQYHVTNTWLVPTQITMMTDVLGEAGPALSELRFIVYGGAPFPQTELAAALRVFGPVLVQCYGQGESPMTITWLPPEDHPYPPGDDTELLRTAGYPRPGMAVRIVDPESDVPVPNGEVGEVTVSGPALMTGYWRRPEATAQTIREGWLYTGDLGRFDAHGRLFLLDRTKDLIISGGSNVYAIEVEQVLLEHPECKDVAVFGIPDRTWGELVTAIVVCAPGAAVTADELRAHCTARIAAYKAPRRVEFDAQIPRNATGKIDKAALRRRYAGTADRESV